MRLDAQQMANALGIAFNQMSGSRQMAVGEATHMRSMQAGFSGQFRRDLKDSDPLHWGEGTVFVSSKSIGLVTATLVVCGLDRPVRGGRIQRTITIALDAGA